MKLADPGTRPDDSVSGGLARPAPDERLALARFTAAALSREVARFSGRPDTLGVGRPGKIGLLELGFDRVGSRTELVRHYQKSPLQIHGPASSTFRDPPFRSAAPGSTSAAASSRTTRPPY